MLVQAIPLFQDAHLLRRNMLESLSDAAFLTNELLYQNYSDGILAGCELTTTKDAIILNKGVVIFGGQLFLMKESMMVNYYPTNQLTLLILKFSDEMRDANFIYREMDIELTPKRELQRGEIELGRFTLQEGARLRYHYQGYEDRNTDYDTLNRVHVPYASLKGHTLARDITESFAREMLAVPSISDWDAMFCIHLLSQNQVIPKEALSMYLTRKKIVDITKDSTNLEIYQGLLKVLKKELGEVKEDIVEKKKWRVSIE